MKTKKTMTKLVAGAALVLAAIAPSFGQNNLGSSCGCPPVNGRTVVSFSTLPGFVAIPSATTVAGELTTGAVLTCDKTYILDQKIYVPSGQVITIEPGTVIKGAAAPQPSLATALIISRGGKINAAGTKDCPIVFTAFADNMSGVYSVSNTAMWGGLVILGKATNNLKLAGNGPVATGFLASADGLGRIEGFATNDPRDRFGVNTSTVTVAGELSSQSFDDNDNSGVLKFVSVRHSGAVLTIGAEINGITLGSVGRGTTIENVEIVSCADDGIEFFGGTVNVKYVSMLFGGDDMFDYDLGWTGKAQFLFGMKSDNSTGFGVDSDNGFEADSDDNRTNALPRSHPVVYNATIIGNNKLTGNTDNSALAAINAKDLTEGEFYNSVFANFRNGLNMVVNLGSGRTATTVLGGAGESYHNWSVANGNTVTPQSLRVKCNTFVNMTNLITTGAGNGAVAGTAVGGTDLTQFTTTDLNTSLAGNTLPGFSYTYTVDKSNNNFSVRNDIVPNPALSVAGCPVAPNDGFFLQAAYRGAFASTGSPWISDWSYSAVIGATQGVAFCATDLNKDGLTDVNDFLIFGPQFNTSCQ
jgi:hypothetical protein